MTHHASVVITFESIMLIPNSQHLLAQTVGEVRVGSLKHMDAGKDSKVIRLKERDDTSTNTRKKRPNKKEGNNTGGTGKGVDLEEVKSSSLRIGNIIKKEGDRNRKSDKSKAQDERGSVRLLAWGKECLLCNKEFKSVAGARLHVQRICFNNKEEEEVIEAWSKRIKKEEEIDQGNKKMGKV